MLNAADDLVDLLLWMGTRIASVLRGLNFCESVIAEVVRILGARYHALAISLVEG
jgi:hypothetical protein